MPYWKYNVFHHNLDVMHIEKNICENLTGTLLNHNKRQKIKAHLDLKDMGIQHDLHLQTFPNNKIYLPLVFYIMSVQ